MNGDRPMLFRGRHFADDVIVLCVRWYLRYSLSYRDLAEMMVERHLSVNPSTIWRWVQRYAPGQRCRCRVVLYLNNIVEQDHRAIKTADPGEPQLPLFRGRGANYPRLRSN